MTYLLDTDVCVDLLRGDPATTRRARRSSPDDLAVSSVTVFELFAGAAKARQPDRETPRLEQFLAVIAELTFDGAAARQAGSIRAHLEARGQTIGPFDLLIAGQALATSRTLVTRNHREFGRVPGLRLEDWGTNAGAKPK